MPDSMRRRVMIPSSAPSSSRICTYLQLSSTTLVIQCARQKTITNSTAATHPVLCMYWPSTALKQRGKGACDQNSQ